MGLTLLGFKKTYQEVTMKKPRILNGVIHPADVQSVVDGLFNGDYQDPIHQIFKEKAEAAGFKVEDYHGRYGYFGPCVKVQNLDEFQSFFQKIKTGIKLQWDDYGKTGKIIYIK